MRLAALLLAAGESRRFGACKQLAPVAGKPLIRHALEHLAPVFGSDLHVVLGARADEIRPLVGDLAQVIEHDGWSAGLGSSIARGVSVIGQLQTYDGVLVALADQPALTSADFRRLLAEFDGEKVVAATHGDRAGVPAVFPASWFNRLQRLDGDRGAQTLLQSADDLLLVSIPAASVDVDRAADIERLAPGDDTWWS